ncbi:unnamed protein product [Ceutorhynchus assimilis]|uniref:Uncharacterized protein n=1 Tax=Ceutorhynchus assimilis TaxID=467358 RepID=A0A9N9MYX1_9CUCU|nr:unnamed protein product [Ceutorhynchus assimilis]
MHFFKSHLVVLLVVLVGTYKCFCRPQNDDKLVKYTSEQDENGYNFNYYIDTGISRNEVAEFKTVGDSKVLAVSGFYEYPGQANDRNTYKVTYAADENGYRAVVQFGQVPQQIPTAVLSSLAGGGLG